MGQSPLLVADGAHNTASAAALAEALREYLEWKRCFFVLGVLSDKDLRGIARKLAPLAASVICCGVENPRARHPQSMADELAALETPVETAETIAKGIERARELADDRDLICVAGSLYAAGEARAHVLGESVGAE